MVQQTPLRVHVSVEETRPQSPLGQATILSRPTLHSAPRLQTANISNQQFHGMATYTLYPPSESANDVALPSEHPSPVKKWTCFLVLFAITTATLLSAVVAAGWSYLCSFSGIVLMRNMAPYSDAHYSAMWATSTVGGVIVGGASGLVLLALSRLDHHADRIWRYGFDPERLRSRTDPWCCGGQDRPRGTRCEARCHHQRRGYGIRDSVSTPLAAHSVRFWYVRD
ncbi:hypothetical protein BKA93DRAFT_566998 [Sparassis latifolia]